MPETLAHGAQLNSLLASMDTTTTCTNTYKYILKNQKQDLIMISQTKSTSRQNNDKHSKKKKKRVGSGSTQAIQNEGGGRDTPKLYLQHRNKATIHTFHTFNL